MSTPNRKPAKRNFSQALPTRKLVSHCLGCDKKAYFERSHAKDERKRLRRADPNEMPLSVYRCPDDDTRWHIGHDHLRHLDVVDYYNSLETGA
jgi:hypothetical protein